MENKFLDAMIFRHACKEFDNSKKISEDDFNLILEAGRLSPSSFGYEPWKFLIVQNEQLRDKLKEFTWGAQGTLPTASHFMIILTRKRPSMIYGSEYVQHIMEDIKQLPQEAIDRYKQFYEKFQKEDFNLLESDRTLFDWACKQTYISLANMMTCAAYIGIDSCPIEGFDATQMEQFLSEELNINTDEFGASVMLAFGYRKEEPREKTRQAQEEIISWYI